VSSSLCAHKYHDKYATSYTTVGANPNIRIHKLRPPQRGQQVLQFQDGGGGNGDGDGDE
jgi:hypothetical protein